MNRSDQHVRAAIRKKLLGQAPDVRAIILMGSTANKRSFEEWDDFDVQVYTSSTPRDGSYYEILPSGRRRFLLSAYFYQLDLGQEPRRTVVDQDDVEVLFGDKEALRHIYIRRPRRTEPLPHELPRFDLYCERFFEILVDIFFILNRCEAKNQQSPTKARIARDGLRTISQHFYRYYGVDERVSTKARWRTTMRNVSLLLSERRFVDICQNKEFVRAGINLLNTA